VWARCLVTHGMQGDEISMHISLNDLSRSAENHMQVERRHLKAQHYHASLMCDYYYSMLVCYSIL